MIKWIKFLFCFPVLFLIFCSESATQPEYNNPRNLKIADLRAALNTMELLLANSISGALEGQYPSAARRLLESRRDDGHEYLLKRLPSARQAEVDSLTESWYSACTEYESAVVSQITGLIDPQATRETRYLHHNLKSYAGTRLLYGMHDATGYGVGWSNDDYRSDVKDVCGSYPALFSWDANGIADNPDERLPVRMLLAYREGLNTLCWHQIDPEGHSFYYDQVNYPVVPAILPGGKYHQAYVNKLERIARYMKRLRGSKGESVPVIFRPFHEQNGSWFWWGRTRCTEQEYIELWRFTVTQLRDSLGVHNFIYAFSPDGNQFTTREEYWREYPGDAFVDIFGLDFYFWEGGSDAFLRFQQRLTQVVQNAQARGKLAALTEVGDELLDIPNWYTSYLLAPIKNNSLARNIIYAAVWRNAHTEHFYAPYPGHASVPDFLAFYQDPWTLFADDVGTIYAL